MLASSALRPEFSKPARESGDTCAAGGHVDILKGGSETVRAQVQGGALYIVTLRRAVHDDATEFVASCTCPGFAAGSSPCKHVWATLVSAERAGYLGGEPGAPALTRESAFLSLRGNSPERARSADPADPGRTETISAAQPASEASGLDFLRAVAERLRTAPRAGDAAFAFSDTTLLYVIDAPATLATGETVLTVMEQRRSRTGENGKPKVAKLTLADIAAAPPIDRRLLALLTGATRRDHSPWSALGGEPRPAAFTLPAPLAMEVLPLIARTARLWLNVAPTVSDPVPLSWDDSNAWTFRLRIDPTPGGYLVDGRLERDDVSVRLDDGFLVLAGGLVAVRRTLARFTRDSSAVFFAELRRSGPVVISATQTDDLLALLAESGTRPEDVPEALRAVEVDVEPRPRLSLRRAVTDDTSWLSADVSFDYHGSIVEAQTTSPTVFDPRTRRIVRRRPDAEARALARLREIGMRETARQVGSVLEVPDHRVPTIARLLLDDGWFVEAEGLRYRAARAVRFSITSNIDWFDVSATVPFDDGHREPLADILARMKSGRSMVTLGDGSVGLVPDDWLARYTPFVATSAHAHGQLQFRRSQVALLDALLSGRVDRAELETDAAFERARAELADVASVEPINEPASFTGTLRPYQREGLGWFGFLRRFGFGGCLADDMGLGKTIMVLALLDARRLSADGAPRRPSLIVVPRSLVGNWLAEAARFAPELRILDHSHGGRDDSTAGLAAYDAVIVTYGTLRRDIDALSAVEFDYAVLDEAQTIKNAATVAAKATRVIRARHRLALSGTPIENHLGELWSLFEFLNPGILGRSSVFHRATASPEDLRETTAFLAQGLRPFVLRRTKQQVAHDLPARTEQTIACELLPKDRRLYERLRLHYRSTVLDHVSRDGLAASHDARTRGAAAVTSGVVPRRADRPEARGRRVREVRRPHPAPAGSRGRRAQGARLLAVHDAPGSARDATRRRQDPLRVPRRQDARPHGAGRALSDRPDHRGVPHQPEGRRTRPQSDGGRLRLPARPLVEPGGRGPGDRPRPPHRPDARGDRLPPHRQGHGRGKGAAAAAHQTGAGRRGVVGQRCGPQEPESRRSGAAPRVGSRRRRSSRYRFRAPMTHTSEVSVHGRPA